MYQVIYYDETNVENKWLAYFVKTFLELIKKNPQHYPVILLSKTETERHKDLVRQYSENQIVFPAGLDLIEKPSPHMPKELLCWNLTDNDEYWNTWVANQTSPQQFVTFEHPTKGTLSRILSYILFTPDQILIEKGFDPEIIEVIRTDMKLQEKLKGFLKSIDMLFATINGRRFIHSLHVPMICLCGVGHGFELFFSSVMVLFSKISNREKLELNLPLNIQDSVGFKLLQSISSHMNTPLLQTESGTWLRPKWLSSTILINGAKYEIKYANTSYHKLVLTHQT